MNVEDDSTEKVEDIFNINHMLITLFSSIKKSTKKKDIELVFDMNSTLPRNLRGDPETLLRMLTKMLTFVFQNSDKKEIVLSLSAPEDFLYEEFISFNTPKSNINKEKILTFLETDLSKDLEILEGKVIQDPDNISDIHLCIPFKVMELGFRRHYRLPDKAMTGKKILLLCTSNMTAQSLKNMFEYFLYDVHIGFDEFQKHGNDLAAYDILIINEKIITEGLKEIIAKAQESSSLKYVLFREPDTLEDYDIEMKTDSEHFIKPATQEKIFDLIVSLYES